MVEVVNLLLNNTIAFDFVVTIYLIGLVGMATLEVAKCPVPKTGGFPLTPHSVIK